MSVLLTAVFFGTVTCVFLPLWESRKELLGILKAVKRDISGNRAS